MPPSLFLERPRQCLDCGHGFTGLLALCGGCAEKRLERDRASLAHRQRQARQQQWLRVCPPVYREMDWSHPGLPHGFITQARAWQPAGGVGGAHSLLLAGPSGKGKTRAAFALLHRFHVTGRSVYALHAGDAWDHGLHIQGLASATRLQYSDDPRLAQAARDCLLRARTCAALLLDDLGKDRASGPGGQISEATSEALFCLLEHRLVYGLTTFITTNADADTIARRLGPDRGPALLRRLMDCCTFLQVGG